MSNHMWQIIHSLSDNDFLSVADTMLGVRDAMGTEVKVVLILMKHRS